MAFELLPLLDDFELEARVLREISSNFCDSGLVDESELESPEGGLEASFESLLEPVSLDRHDLDLPLSGVATTGTVRPLEFDSGSNETLDMDWSRDEFVGGGEFDVSGVRRVSETLLLEGLREISLIFWVSM